MSRPSEAGSQLTSTRAGAWVAATAAQDEAITVSAFVEGVEYLRSVVRAWAAE